MLRRQLVLRCRPRACALPGSSPLGCAPLHRRGLLQPRATTAVLRPSSSILCAHGRHIASTSQEQEQEQKKEGAGADLEAYSTVAGKPDIASVMTQMPVEMYQMSNDVLLAMSAAGCFEAKTEIMIREVMRIDKISWDDGAKVVEEMSEYNKKGIWKLTIPHKAGIAVFFTAAVVSIPMIFDRKMALWFNENYVTSDVPPDSDLETMWEVGTWTWNWMEPPLGEISFVLLALQFVRAQMQNIGWRPYTAYMVERRAIRLCKRYSKYSRRVVHDFAINDIGLKVD